MKITFFKQKLEEEKKLLEESMGKIGRRNLAVPGDWEPIPPEVGSEPDPVDQADISEARETDAAILSDLEARYDTILDALKRIEHNNYGICVVCNKEISADRLGADPAATTCVNHL